MNIAERAKPEVKMLLQVDENSLFEQAGLRTKANQEGSKLVTELNPTIVHDAVEMGPLDDLRELGKRVVKRWTRELHNVVCGEKDDDASDRKNILDAIGIGDGAAIAAAITAVLVGSFGVAAAVATVVAALIVKRIISPAGDEICKFWDEKLAVE